jgi:hypothetical protein
MKLSRMGAIAAVALGAFALSAGCERREEQALGTERERPGAPAPQEAPGVPPATPQEPPSAPQGQQGRMPPGAQPAAQIAEARCELEQRCGRIGPGQRYESREACLSAVRSEWQEDLHAYECPAGFNAGELNECLAEIRTEDCESPIQRLGSFVACRASDICENY